jgi:hypothetical protein
MVNIAKPGPNGLNEENSRFDMFVFFIEEG